MDRVRKEEVRCRTEIARQLAEEAEERVLRWFGYVERMEKGRLVKKVSLSDVRGTSIRTSSRQLTRRMHSVKRALDAVGMSVE